MVTALGGGVCAYVKSIHGTIIVCNDCVNSTGGGGVRPQSSQHTTTDVKMCLSKMCVSKCVRDGCIYVCLYVCSRWFHEHHNSTTAVQTITGINISRAQQYQ